MSQPLAAYPHLAARVFDVPLLVHPQKLDAILCGLAPRLLGSDALRLPAQADDPQGPAPQLFTTRKGERAERGYRVVDGVAVLNVGGLLVHRSRFVAAESSYLQGYNDLAADIEDAMGNPDVHAVLQVYDSPGGEVSGAFELAQRIHALRGKKPMWAIADSLAASAAYLAASAAERVCVTQTGYVGSIGVVMRHADLSRAMDREGITITHIYAGAHKVDGNPYEPLPREVREQLGAEVQALYDMFVDAVARHRGIASQAVRATEARTYRAEAAVQQRLADRVSTCDALISELAALRARPVPVGRPAHANAIPKEVSMSDSTPAAGPAPATPITAASGAPEGAAAPAAATASADTAATIAAAVAQAVAAERERVAAILAHPEAQGRAALAQQCVALGLPLDQAAALLAASPKADGAQSQAGAPSQFDQLMRSLNPQVSGIEAPAQDERGPGQIQASWAQAFGLQQ